MNVISTQRKDHPDNHTDDHVDDEIITCLNLNFPTSFFLFAGAGSGKTRSLVHALKYIRDTLGENMLLNKQQVAIITYTNAACDEIQRRIDYHPLFEISTIHSFAWNLIKPYTVDIKNWIEIEIERKIVDLTDKQARSRGDVRTQAFRDRARDLDKLNRRLQNLSAVKQFNYNPNGENTGKDSINHSEVIKICTNFLNQKSLLQNILVNKYPIFLIDESQDTKADLLLALLSVQKCHVNKFVMGLFGDTMQRIYVDGLKQLEQHIPPAWQTPAKVMNHRSQKRIVDLINDIRKDVDGKQQKFRKEKNGGYVHLYITQFGINTFDTENKVRNDMAELTNDQLWKSIDKCKCLTIEHHMAAKRLNFENFFTPLYAINSFKTGLLDGTLTGIAFFSNNILPLYKAYFENNDFEIMRIVRNNSSIFKVRKKTKDLVIQDVLCTQNSIKELLNLWENNNDPTCLEILLCVSNNCLFDVPENLSVIVDRFKDSQEEPAIDSNEYYEEKIEAWANALKVPFSEFCRYYNYVIGNSSFDTHQGVKGLEFPRVMLVIDDDESRGSTFNYNKLFGIVSKTTTDIKNEQDGNETSIDRTRRLFYVTCSRAEESLAIVYYTGQVNDAKKHILETGWFSYDELSIIE